MLSLSNMADTFLEEFTRCAKGLWAFSDADWLGGKTPITWINNSLKLDSELSPNIKH